MPDIRKIICPNPACKVILTIGYINGIETKSLTCPKCHTSHLYTEYIPYTQPEGKSHKKQSVPENDSDMTDVHNVFHQNDKHKEYSSDETHINDFTEYKEGSLVVPGSMSPIPLQMGENVVGRRANSSSASIQVNDPSNRMSRSHFRINVVRQNGKGNFHLISLTPGSKNKSYVNDMELPAGDEYILHHGDRIRVGEVTIVFKEH